MGESEKASFSWFWDFWTCPWLPTPTIFYLWRPRDTLHNPRKVQSVSEKYRFCKSSTFGNPHFGKVWGIPAPTNSDDPLFENLEYEINIFQKTWNGNLVIWDHYLPINTSIFETLQLWNKETNKPRNQDNNKPNKPKHQKAKSKQEFPNQETNKPRNRSSYPSTYRLPPLHQRRSWGTRGSLGDTLTYSGILQQATTSLGAC